MAKLSERADQVAMLEKNLISLDHLVVGCSIAVAREVAGGIRASIFPTVRRGFVMHQRFLILNFGSLHKDWASTTLSIM